MANEGFRTERDSLGEVQVPAEALWGAQTQRAVENFPDQRSAVSARIHPGARADQGGSGGRQQGARAPGRKRAAAIQKAAPKWRRAGTTALPARHFPDRVGHQHQHERQRGDRHAGVAELGRTVHPNDHVNMGQSSNDVIPDRDSRQRRCSRWSETCCRRWNICGRLIDDKAQQVDDVVKTGRTHLMDAMPMTLSQEMSGWSRQIEHGIARAGRAAAARQLALGGTAIGTGINAHPRFRRARCREAARRKYRPAVRAEPQLF